MAVSLQVLQQQLDTILTPEKFQDYCPNGLQVEGRPEVKLLVSGVTANQALLDEAVAVGADAVLVHHGYFWRGESAEIIGMKKRRLATLLKHDISLLAYHLPLDAHPIYGNNCQLARVLDIEISGELDPVGSGVGNIGELHQTELAEDFVKRVSKALGRDAQHIAGGAESIQRIAWCTGAAQGYIEHAVAQGVDLYLSGEISEPTVHIAREAGIHYVAAGHHATERYGVQALGSYVAEVNWVFSTSLSILTARPRLGSLQVLTFEGVLTFVEVPQDRHDRQFVLFQDQILH